MSVTYGFYNSRNHDRVYDAVQLSSIFDGIINDGIIQNYGGAFQVTNGTDMRVSVATGRAWFNHTWTLNDASLSLTVPAAGSQPRIDSVILEVDLGNRVNSIKILRGTPAASPSAPTLTNGPSVYQYRLANLRIEANASSVGTVTDTRGGSESPWASSVVSGTSNYVLKSGDTMTGTLGLKAIKGEKFNGANNASSPNTTYGPNLPAPGTAGRIFFKTLS